MACRLSAYSEDKGVYILFPGIDAFFCVEVDENEADRFSGN
jgi:hypothetical protein